MSRRFGQRRSQYAPPPVVLGPWPNGAQGDFILRNGAPSAILNAGTTYNYRDFTIESANFLAISFNSYGWIVIGVSGNLNIEGNIFYGSLPNGNYVTTAPDGTFLSGGFSDAGAGGGGNAGYPGTSGGSAFNGNAGGGGGDYAGLTADSSGGGRGGDGINDDSGNNYGGAGGLIYTNNGDTPPNVFNTFGYDIIGPGGGGGASGGNGGLIFFRVRGNISGSGTFNLAGGNGGSGGSGANADGSFGSLQVAGGGGGGGGAGGSGGQLVIAYSGTDTTSFTLNLGAGTAGSGGIGGLASGGSANVNGNDGTAGYDGSSGFSNIYSV